MKKTIFLLACLLLLPLFQSFGQLNPDVYYPLNETSGQAMNYTSGSNNSTSVSATYGASGILYTAFLFNGTSNKITFADNSLWTINTSDNVSIAAWINFTGDNSASYGNIFGSSSTYSFQVLKISSGNYQLLWYCGGATYQTSSTFSVTNGVWYHIAMVRTGSTNVKFFLNSTVIGSSTPGDVNSDPTANYIGGDEGGEYFNGKIDEVGFWKRALSDQEVSYLYNGGVGLSYPFNQPVPSVLTSSVTSITQTTATCGGNVTFPGSASVTARGVCWSTSANPTTSNSKTTDGSGIGSFTSSITGLTAGTTYHVRAYATNSTGTVYGSDISFTTTAGAPTIPVITTTTPSNITTTTATGGGNITSNGGAAITASGVCWATTANPTTSSSKTTDNATSGSFTSSITGLSPNTTYHVRAYATNSVGTGYGSDLTFTTNANATIPVLTTASPSAITANTATGGGNITSNGGATITVSGVCWSTTANPTTSSSKTTDGSITGSFSSTISGLTASTTYHVRAYATNSAGTGYGSDLTFTTAAATAPVLTTVTPANITATTATGGGNITSNGGTPVTVSGVCWSTSSNPTTTSSSKTTDGTTTGTFSSSITGLTASTTYHVRAYATNSVGTNYGSDMTFTTSTVVPSWLTSTNNIYFNYTNGKVGIQTANPVSELTVNGKIVAKEIELVSSIASDYVFDKEYQLMPLTDLEIYLKKNKHLPEIPSAAEFAKQGQNLGKMDDLLLRKVEELTLYIIKQGNIINEQSKAIEELKKEVDALKAR
jgi:hypothetical protein